MSALKTALGIVAGDRNSVYGPPYDDFGRICRMWAAILGVPEVPPETVALMMCALKIGRLCQTPGHEDSIVDLAGYTRTYELVREERARRSSEIRPRLSDKMLQPWPAVAQGDGAGE